MSLSFRSKSSRSNIAAMASKLVDLSAFPKSYASRISHPNVVVCNPARSFDPRRAHATHSQSPLCSRSHPTIEPPPACSNRIPSFPALGIAIRPRDGGEPGSCTPHAASRLSMCGPPVARQYGCLIGLSFPLFSAPGQAGGGGVGEAGGRRSAAIGGGIRLPPYLVTEQFRRSVRLVLSFRLSLVLDGILAFQRDCIRILVVH